MCGVGELRGGGGGDCVFWKLRVEEGVVRLGYVEVDGGFVRWGG